MLIKAYHDSGSVGDSSGARPSDKVGGGGSFPKKNSALQTSVWSKDSSGGGGWPLRAPPLDLPLGDDNSNSTGSDIDFNFVPQTKLNLWLSLICKPVLKSLFWVPTCVPRFKYASLSC